MAPPPSGMSGMRLEVPVRLAVAVAVAAGVLIAVQTTILGAFGTRLPPFVASTWVHVGGLTFGVVGILVTRSSFHVDAVRQAPWGLLAGVAGLLLVAGIAYAVAGVGLASTLALVTGTQLLVGFVFESRGVLGEAVALDPGRLIGAVMIVGGVYLVVARGPAVG